MRCTVCQRDIDPITSDPRKIDDCHGLRGCVPLLPTVSPVACPDCDTMLGVNHARPANPPTTALTKKHLMYSELDEQLSNVRTLLASQERRRVADRCFPKNMTPEPTVRVETHHPSETNNTSLSRSANTTQMASGISAGVWRILLPGGAACTFGFMMLLWSLLTSQTEWSNAGLAAMITGQAALLTAAMLLFGHVRHGHRDLSAKIDATIAGLHVLRKEQRIARSASRLPASNTALFHDRKLQQRFADIKKQITKVRHSLAG